MPCPARALRGPGRSVIVGKARHGPERAMRADPTSILDPGSRRPLVSPFQNFRLLSQAYPAKPRKPRSAVPPFGIGDRGRYAFAGHCWENNLKFWTP